ncbi:hypothetical protein BUE93_02360 [Chromobacterium amazonense]|uniref:HTH luxR-type domain-containing protein n=1 Tax=Chromobacterium amazonense TaxID=1382803 RepID=A0A2S9X987_9NEIS|nr:LuxR C-terminal-related transcriptional regulator [Chromobacterium amazonense]PRP72301.1 hypothetical protein BUE93_02360 [Chromobacterium amazonense]
MDTINFQSDLLYATNPSFTLTNQVIEFSRPLKSFNIDYFTFDRHYKDGSRVALTNSADWIIHYWRKEMFRLAIFESAPDSFSSGHVFWSWLKREPIYSAAAEFGIDNGVTLIEQHHEYCDFFHFGSIHNNALNNDALLRHMPVLQRFCGLFTYKLSDAIALATKHRIVVPGTASAARPEQINPSMLDTDFSMLLERRDVSRIYLGEAYNNAYLTKKEISLMQRLILGDSCQEAAEQLSISCDAINKHIKNIKDRLNCKSLCQLGFVMGRLSARNLYPFSLTTE